MSDETTDSSKLPELMGVQRLYPDFAHRFNDWLLRTWRENELHSSEVLAKDEKDAYIVPMFFSKHSRTFHWMGLGSRMWDLDDEECKGQIKGLVNALRNWIVAHDGAESWQSYLTDLPTETLYDNARIRIEAELRKPPGDVNVNESLHRALVALYSGYHHPANRNLEGIAYWYLSEYGQKKGITNLKSVEGKVGKHDKSNTLDWLEIKIDDETKYFDFLDVDNGPQPTKPGYSLPTDDSEKNPQSLANEVFLKYLLGDTKGSDGKHEFSKRIAGHAYVSLWPIYDIWPHKDYGVGGIWGFAALFFKKGKEGKENDVREKWIDNKGAIFSKVLAECAAGLATSAEVQALAEPIVPRYDLLRHFLKVLRFVQDWESAVVFEGSQAIYRFDRTPPEGESAKWGWEFSHCKGADCDGPSKEPDSSDTLQQVKSTEPAEPNKFYLWWKKSFWRSELIPGLRDDEKEAFEELSIRFEFPKACRIPEDEPSRKALSYAYLRRQLGLLRQLLPKVRARRAALRSAVSAIMGRNMSHNIGSHVLARYANRIGSDLKEAGTDKGKADWRGEFLAYLQRRMDFLAEVATSDRAFWSQPLSLREVAGRLNYAEQCRRYADQKPCPVDEMCHHHLSPKSIETADKQDEWPGFRPILLSYITGKESLLASVEYGAPVSECTATDNLPEGCCRGFKSDSESADEWIAFPGGEVGAHAFYVILENIIRNSARHGGQGDGTVRVFVHVIDDKQKDNDCVTVEIIDPRTHLNAYGIPVGVGQKGDNDKNIEAEQQAEELDRKGLYSLYEDEGGKPARRGDRGAKRTKLASLYREINSILQDEEFLDESGNPNPNYWGVREMQICANYLRGLPLSDLESASGSKDALVLKAGRHDLPNDGYCLKYSLKLPRARLMAAVINDSSDYDKRSANLRRRGIVVKDASQGWESLATKLQGYGMVVVEDTKSIPAYAMAESGASGGAAAESKVDTCIRASLPVRTFNLEEGIIKGILITEDTSLDWMEPLYKHWAKLCRDQETRKNWRDKPMYGVIIGGDALKAPGEDGLAKEPADDGLFWVKSTDQYNSGICPLPGDQGAWYERLISSDRGNPAIAAAWLDHPRWEEWSKSALLYASGVAVEDMPLPVWISAEGAYSDSPHTPFINACRGGCGWELLAAAVPRVVVLDERVQSERHRSIRNDNPLNWLWLLMGVWVPNKPNEMFGQRTGAEIPDPRHGCDLDAPKWDEIREFLKRPAWRDDQYPVDFLVIHLTILERLQKEWQNQEQNEDKYLSDMLVSLLKDTEAAKAEIIVVTGRGVPSMARRLGRDERNNGQQNGQRYRYLPISALLESLVTRPSKLTLMRALWSAAQPLN